MFMRGNTPRRKVFRPALEQLETRECLSFNISYSSSLLLIRGHPTLPFVNPGDGLQLHLANGLVQVREVGGATTINYGSYRPPQNVQIALDYNTDHDLTIDLGGGRLPSNLLVNLGKGNTDFLSPHFDNLVNGTLGGTLTILGGSGGELIDLGSLGGGQPVVIQGDTSLSLSANHTSLGGDFLFVNNGSQLLGRLTGTEVDNIDVGLFGMAVVRKDVSLSVPHSGNVGRLHIYGEVDGNVTFQGSPVVDPSSADGVFVETGGTVLGSVTATLGNGQGDVEIHGTVAGNVSFTGALGNDEVILDGSVLGAVQMNLRSGDNDVEFTGAVGGSLSITAGDGNNDLTTFTGLVGGDLTFNLGNGNDSATITNAPGGRLFWTSGNGNDILTLAPTADNQVWNVNVQFGSGDDTFTLGGLGNGEILTGRVDGGGRITANAFNQGANWALQNFTLSNFP